MEELKRFFTSINFAYNSDFDDSTIEKVMYLKKDNLVIIGTNDGDFCVFDIET